MEVRGFRPAHFFELLRMQVLDDRLLYCLGIHFGLNLVVFVLEGSNRLKFNYINVTENYKFIVSFQ